MRASSKTVIGLVMVLGSLAAGLAHADEATKRQGGSNASIEGAGAGSAGGSTLTAPGNGGVAGTGLGKMPDDKTAPGKGNSVSGPAGQGLTSEPETATPIK